VCVGRGGDGISNCGCIALNCGIFASNSLEGSGRGMVEVVLRNLPEEPNKNFNLDNRCPVCFEYG
jgi:hypothetical protein